MTREEVIGYLTSKSFTEQGKDSNRFRRFGDTCKKAIDVNDEQLCVMDLTINHWVFSVDLDQLDNQGLDNIVSYYDQLILWNTSTPIQA